MIFLNVWLLAYLVSSFTTIVYFGVLWITLEEKRIRLACHTELKFHFNRSLFKGADSYENISFFISNNSKIIPSFGEWKIEVTVLRLDELKSPSLNSSPNAVLVSNKWYIFFLDKLECINCIAKPIITRSHAPISY